MNTYIGKKLGSYEIIRQIGRGGFAEVYEGRHVDLGKSAAIKILQTQLVAAEERKTFEQEARLLSDLKHPNIVQWLEYGLDNGLPYLILEYASKGSLRQRYSRGTRLAPGLIVSYLNQIADALAYAHKQKVIHRDVKPENILMGKNGEILLTDFNIAVISETSRSQPAMGTIVYMAPEQYQRHASPASDQYSLAVVVYEWICGQCPFGGTANEIALQLLTAPPPPLRQFVTGISSEIEQVVLKALAKDPQQRYPGILDFSKAFEQACSKLPATGGMAAFQSAPVPTILVPPVSPVSPVPPVPPIVGPAPGGFTPPPVPASPVTPGAGVPPFAAGGGWPTPGSGQGPITGNPLHLQGQTFASPTNTTVHQVFPFGPVTPPMGVTRVKSDSNSLHHIIGLEKQNLQHPSNTLFLFAGLALDFLFSLLLGFTQHSWYIWFWSLLLPIVARLWYVAARNKSISMILAVTLSLYWGLAAALIESSLTSVSFLGWLPPGGVVGPLVGIAGGAFHIVSVLKKGSY